MLTHSEESPGSGGLGQNVSATAPKSCNGCDLCCRLLEIRTLGKAPGRPCSHQRGCSGCGIHADKPAECAKFQCLWTLVGDLGEEWRPDRSGLLLWSDNPQRLIVDVDPLTPTAWRNQPYLDQLRRWADRNIAAPIEVLVRVAGRIWVVFPEAEIELGPYSDDLAIDSGYRLKGRSLVPYARFVQPATAA